jgi:hypothetical protein
MIQTSDTHTCARGANSVRKARPNPSQIFDLGRPGTGFAHTIISTREGNFRLVTPSASSGFALLSRRRANFPERRYVLRTLDDDFVASVEDGETETVKLHFTFTKDRSKARVFTYAELWDPGNIAVEFACGFGGGSGKDFMTNQNQDTQPKADVPAEMGEYKPRYRALASEMDMESVERIRRAYGGDGDRDPYYRPTCYCFECGELLKGGESIVYCDGFDDPVTESGASQQIWMHKTCAIRLADDLRAFCNT